MASAPQLNTMTFMHEAGCPYMTAAGGMGQCTCTPEQKEIKRLKTENASLRLAATQAQMEYERAAKGWSDQTIETAHVRLALRDAKSAATQAQSEREALRKALEAIENDLKWDGKIGNAAILKMRAARTQG